MSIFAVAAPAGLALLIAGCAGGMSSAQCTGADWTALGLADGRAGAPAKRVEERRSDCGNAGVDAAAYAAARSEGLLQYCTPTGGFAAGREGGKYEGVCPADSELAFLDAFARGGKLYTLTSARDRAVRDYETAITDLDQHRYLLRVAENRSQKSSIGNEDRELSRQDADYRRREIARIEGRMPEMLNRIEATRAALDAYNAELAAIDALR